MEIREEERKTNELTVFESAEFGSIRTVEIEGKPYFVASDVAKALGHARQNDAVSAHCRYAVKHSMPHPQSKTKTLEVNVIPQGDVVRLAVKSELQGAEKFESWIFDEVIPSVLNHGMYATDELINNPDLLIAVATQLKEERERNKRLEEQRQVLERETIEMDKKISELTPKANYVDVILKSKSTVLVTQIAQDYGMSAKAFNRKLKELGIQHKVGRQWILYGKYQGQGYVHSQTINIERSNGQADVVMQTEWTQKGRLFLYEELKKHEIYPMIERVA